MTTAKNNSQSNYRENKLTEVGNTESSVFRYFLSVFGIFSICNADVGIGVGIWKYRDIGSVSVLPTHHQCITEQNAPAHRVKLTGVQCAGH